MIAQEEFGGGVFVGTDPVAYGGGVVHDVLEAGVPGSFIPAGIQQFFDFVEDIGFDAVTDAGYFPFAAFVAGGKAGDAEGCRAGGAAVFIFEDGRGHFLFCGVHGFVGGRSGFRVFECGDFRLEFSKDADGFDLGPGLLNHVFAHVVVEDAEGGEHDGDQDGEDSVLGG